MSLPPPPGPLDADTASRLAADLHGARYTVDALRDLWGLEADAALARDEREPARRRVAARAGEPGWGAAAALAALFVLADPVASSALDAALPAVGAAGALALGLVRPAGPDVASTGMLVAAVDLRPYGVADDAGETTWWISSDLGELALGGPIEPEHVLGLGGATSTLAGIQSTVPVDSALDLGTGSGVQAMHASRVARRVVATDISARALAFAAFNLALNGIRNVELRRGDLLEPVTGELFDSIVSNPPFVITPRVADVPAYDYRDGGRIGDDLVADVVAGVGRHLAPGGTARLLGNWEDRRIAVPGRAGPRTESGLARAERWVRDAGLGGWLIERDHLDPPLYAETWIRDGGTRPGSEGFEGLYRAWLDDFADRGVAGVGFGYLLLAAPDADGRIPPIRSERVTTVGADGALGEHLDAALAGMRALDGLDGDALGSVTFRVASDVTEERTYRPGAADPEVLLLSQTGGLGRQVPVDTALAAVVGACDGELPAGVLCDAVAGLLDADPAAVRRTVLPRLAELVACGMLTPLGGTRARSTMGA